MLVFFSGVLADLSSQLVRWGKIALEIIAHALRIALSASGIAPIASTVAISTA